VQMHPYI